VVAALDRMGLPYAIGGSIASSTYGAPRFTQDADITIEPFAGKEAEFAAHFDAEFYVSVPAIQQANRRRSSFNLLHLTSGFKIDFFVRKDVPFAEAVMKRRRMEPLSQLGGQRLFLVSPEDIVLLKLEWYRLGNEVSDRQFSDVLGVLKMQGDKLDLKYLMDSAATLGVTDLLDKRGSAPSLWFCGHVFASMALWSVPSRSVFIGP
jgi:hypothetical protein